MRVLEIRIGFVGGFVGGYLRVAILRAGSAHLRASLPSL